MMISGDFVKDRVAAFLKVPARDIPDEMALSRLIADSFMIVELMIELEETCGIRLSQEEVKHVKTVGELTSAIIAAASSHAADATAGEQAVSAKRACNV